MTILGLALVTASFVVQPTAWTSWVDFLAKNLDASNGPWSSPLLAYLGLAVGAVLAVLAGIKKEYRWLLVLAVILVSPTMGPNTLTLFAALPRLQASAGLPRAVADDEAHSVV